jgi:hypothetical protein
VFRVKSEGTVPLMEVDDEDVKRRMIVEWMLCKISRIDFSSFE